MRSLSTRLTLGSAGIVTLMVILLLVAGRLLLEHELMRGIDLLNDAEFRETQHRLEDYTPAMDREALITRVAAHTELDASMFLFQFSRKDDPVLFSSRNLQDERLLLSHNSGKLDSTPVLDEIGPVRVGTYELKDMTIAIGSPLSHVHELLSGYWRMSVTLTVAVGIISLAIGYLLTRMAMRPVRAMQETAKRISVENLGARIPVPYSGDEMGKLALFLNSMFDRLQSSFQQVAQFTANASHELRTPLALIRLQAESVLNDPDLPDIHKESLVELLTEVERLNKIIADLLFLARADGGVLPLDRKWVNVGGFLKEFSEDAIAMAEDHGLHFRYHSRGDGAVSIDATWVRHVLWNLLGNAIKFSPSGGQIFLESIVSENAWEVSIEDEGPGVPEDMLESIFKRFHRIPQSSDGLAMPEKQGSGLGLAICRSILLLHGGNIHATKTTTGKGLRVSFKLPMG